MMTKSQVFDSYANFTKQLDLFVKDSEYLLSLQDERTGEKLVSKEAYEQAINFIKKQYRYYGPSNHLDAPPFPTISPGGFLGNVNVIWEGKTLDKQDDFSLLINFKFDSNSLPTYYGKNSHTQVSGSIKKSKTHYYCIFDLLMK